MAKIQVLKTTRAASSIDGAFVKEYLAGQTYDIFEELAQTFVKQGWGVKFEEKAVEKAPENKAMQSAPENKSFEVLVEEKVEELVEEIVDSSESDEVIQKTKKRGKK